MAPFRQKALAFIRLHALIEKGDSVLAAVSGGADSVALLLFLRDELAGPLNLKLAAAHFNHGLRGKDSDGDQAFVENLCRRLGIPVFTEKAPVKKAKGQSPEEAAREARYAFLARAAEAHGFKRIATAHHQDDQAETLLMRMITGTGLSGLSGIRPKNGRLIRPFLTVPRKELRRYLEKRGQRFRWDKSNRNARFLRNKIRLRLMPPLERNFGSHVPETLSRLALQASADMDISAENARRLLAPLIRDRAPGRLVLDLERLSAYPRYLIKVLLETSFGMLGRPATLSSAHLTSLAKEVLEGRHGGAVHLPKGFCAENSYGNLLIRTRRPPESEGPADFSFPKNPGVYPWDAKGLIVTVETVDKKAGPAFPGDREPVAWLDHGALSKVLILRKRREGDRFRPLGSPGAMKLKDFLINRKVPRDQRDSLHLLCSGKEIAWVVGHRISERFKVHTKTRKIAIISIVK
jgi:tRNA(Ile)-lysidine synthase